MREWVTNTRYGIAGGRTIPSSIAGPGHIAVSACRRDGGDTLTVTTAVGLRARALVPATNADPRP
ncbi:hypothetical protein EF294_18025 [Gordonia oryzae]|uniref:Uncharacterized protein n=1 Tax=Gordonia oryzae TaxID=2487349 RepID=A0A3N4GAS3_9ACTN|nr:hypothetical protein [Gordonia oryzae]RPA57676.1 hypothetical protein EF294_18025 [Gordonia oryzae]